MPKTVLIAEDHADLRTMTRHMLESFGYNVIEARDGSEALEEAKTFRPDLILMDISMPQMNGITAASLIHHSATGENIPIVAVTSYDPSYIGEAGELGFDRIVRKPVTFEELKVILDEFLGPAVSPGH
jgi:CheY-like chemotaxis protein